MAIHVNSMLRGKETKRMRPIPQWQNSMDNTRQETQKRNNVIPSEDDNAISGVL